MIFFAILLIVVLTILSIRKDMQNYKKSSFRRFEEGRNSITYSDSYNKRKECLRRFLTDCIIELKKQNRTRTHKNKN